MTGNELMAALEQLQHDHPERMNNHVFVSIAYDMGQIYTMHADTNGIWLE